MDEMICTCRADGVREVEARRLRIFRRMGLEHMDDLTTAIILSLGADFQADAEVYADQWMGISLTTPLLEKGLFIACDWPWDGLAALWEELAERFPELVSVNPETAPMAVRVVERVSAALFSNYESAESLYREHRIRAHDDKDFPPCEDCSVLQWLSVITHRTLDEAWGSRGLELAVEKAYKEAFED